MQNPCSHVSLPKKEWRRFLAKSAIGKTKVRSFVYRAEFEESYRRGGDFEGGVAKARRNVSTALLIALAFSHSGFAP